MSICPKVLYDNKKSNFVIYNNQKNKNAINYRYQGPRSGLTNVFTLNPFFGNYKIPQTELEKQLNNGTLPPLPTKGYLAKINACTTSQDSNRCIQLRRSLRNYNNSQGEIKKRRNNRLVNNKNPKRYNNNYPNLLFYFIKKNKNGSKIFKKMCKVNGTYQCKGRIIVPKNMSLSQYLCMINKQKQVVYYSIDHYTDDNQIVYNKYVYINGLWNFDTKVTFPSNKKPPSPFIHQNRNNLIPKIIQS